MGCTNIINIILSYIFVMKLGMGSDGVALGTVIAQYSGLFIALYFFRKYFKRLFKYWSFRAATQWSKLKNFLVVNQDIFIRTMCLVIVFSIFTTRSASSDVLTEGEDTILAVNSLLMQFFMFFSFLIDGFAHASEALTGRFIGATAGKEMRNAMLVSALLVFFPAYFILSKFLGNHGLWLSFILFMMARGVTMSLLANRAVLSKVT